MVEKLGKFANPLRLIVGQTDVFYDEHFEAEKVASKRVNRFRRDGVEELPPKVISG